MMRVDSNIAKFMGRGTSEAPALTGKTRSARVPLFLQASVPGSGVAWRLETFRRAASEGHPEPAAADSKPFIGIA